MAFILVVEDNESLLAAMKAALESAGHKVRTAPNAEEAKQTLNSWSPDLILTDLRLPGASGIDLLKEARGLDPFLEVIVITAYGTVEKAVEAMRAGAFDFLTKPVRMSHLAAKVEQALQVRRDRLALQRERERRSYLEEEIRSEFNEGEIIGRSPAMVNLFRTIEKVAPSDSSVLIMGESGTGKELVARAIHMRSKRSQGPFVRVNCGALSEGVLESELFGHERGAFTGAVRQRRGRFELADGGTLFLDEVADIGPAVQVRLLRVLQEREFERVGGERTIQVDVRVIAATNKDIRREVEEGRFREDLFYRLYVVPIELPPLRERKEDIPLLVRHFIGKICARMGREALGVSDEALKVLKAYDWPGNVRELENAIERAIVLCDSDTITEVDLPLGRVGQREDLSLPAGMMPLREAVERLERGLIQRALEQAGGVKVEAARLLEIKPSVLHYKLEKYGLL